MKIDLNKGISIRIAGELGKFNTIPVDDIVKISHSLQELIIDIAKNELSDNETVDLNNFKIDLSGFKIGSAVPQFSFTQKVKPTINDITIQREVVSKKFDQLVNIADGGRYSELQNVYPDSNRRNQMVNSLYGFVNSFGTTPVSFVDVTESNEISEIYKIKKFKPETRNALLTEIETVVAEPQAHYGVAKIKLTTTGKKTKKKIEELYTKSNTMLSYAPDVIVHQGDSYLLNFPLRCSLEKEDDYYLIQSELLDIVGTGETEDEAEINFAEEFSFIYKRYNELTDEKLSDRIVSIKTILNYIVKSVEK